MPLTELLVDLSLTLKTNGIEYGTRKLATENWLLQAFVRMGPPVILLIEYTGPLVISVPIINDRVYSAS